MAGPSDATHHCGSELISPLPLPTDILVRTPNWLGDLIVATDFVRALLARFPAARVDLIVRQGFEELPLPHRGKLLPYDKARQGAGAFGSALRRGSYSHMFVLPPSFSSAWMAFRSGIPMRLGYRGELRAWLLRPALRHRHPPRSVHLLQEYIDLLRPWGEPGDVPAKPHLDACPEWIASHYPVAAPAAGPGVVLAPGAEYGPAKQWPAAHYRVLAQALAERGWPLTVAGLAKDHRLGEEILAGLPSASNLCGQTNLPQLVALLARADLAVSNDSGAMHLAAALGRPQIALFGSTNPAWTGPLNPAARVLTRNEWCAPCYARACRFGHTRCLADLAPRDAVEAALELLGDGSRAPTRGGAGRR